MSRTLAYSLILLTWFAPAAPAETTGEAVLASYLRTYPTQVAYLAVRLDDGAVIATRAAEAPMIPASVQKIATSAVALATLGEDFHFRTRLAVSGSHVLVLGDGDPTFGDPVLAAAKGQTIYHVLDKWAGILKARGITSIDGKLVLDDDIFQERRHRDWPKAQHQRWYCAPVSGLNYNDNCLDIRIRLVGGAPQADVSPAARLLPVVNQLRVGSKHVWRVQYADRDAVATLKGTVSKSMDDPISVAVNEPSLLLGRVFADRLAIAGIAMTGPVVRANVLGATRTVPADVTVIAEHATSLPVVLKRANKRSLNLAAECLLLRSAVQRTGRGTWAAGSRTAHAVLTEQYGIPAGQITVADGGGMSRTNRMSPSAAVRILTRLASGKGSAAFLSSLPVAGVDGTLAKRLTAHRGRVLAKTGTLSGVVTLAGYILDNRGRPAIAFAIFCNNVRGGNYRAREAADALVGDWVAVTGRRQPPRGDRHPGRSR